MIQIEIGYDKLPNSCILKSIFSENSELCHQLENSDFCVKRYHFIVYLACTCIVWKLRARENIHSKRKS